MSDLIQIKGIGEKTIKLLNKLGINNKEDLLYYYPKDYELFSDFSNICDIHIGDVVTIKAYVITKPLIIRKNRFILTTCKVDDGTGRISCSWFNSPFILSYLKINNELILRGKVVESKNKIYLSQARIYSNEQYNKLKGKLLPIYNLTKGIQNQSIRKYVSVILKEYDSNFTKDYLPKFILKERELPKLCFALNSIHFPNEYKDLYIARNRLVYDEFFIFYLSIKYLKQIKSKIEIGIIKNLSDIFSKKVIENLPFNLTISQKNAYLDIIKDLNKNIPMNRLIQGDVGSGKTIIAFLAMFYMCSANKQSAFMCPTEVLAKQHYNNINKIIYDNKLPIKAILILGSQTKKERKINEQLIKSKEALIAIGTHALLSKEVEFNDLSLVITDEQHRFGVNQRKALENKSKEINTLVMSATPIPRTLALLLYSDLNISLIKEKPIDRIPIKNAIINESYRNNAYNFIQKEIQKKHQAYIVCPQVEPNDEELPGSFLHYENVYDYTKKLKEILPSNINIQILHGKMKSSEKEKIMQDFYNNNIDILVSTTVIEVGIDNPNATIMMIENADRFGLATLHQLRGRVGRGKNQSYAIFVNTSNSEISNKRLEVLKHSNDGFYIADHDLKLRGPGDIFGVKQSGSIEFNIADIYTDKEILYKVIDDVSKLLLNDPQLLDPKNKSIKDKLNNYLENKYVL
ncbi:MAG: ATP-dependent DNA helicase RecG [Eubacteriales bacterium]|nr:ATP-dependent DNA helicase RecG [Eubacteriales bacterium]